MKLFVYYTESVNSERFMKWGLHNLNIKLKQKLHFIFEFITKTTVVVREDAYIIILTLIKKSIPLIKYNMFYLNFYLN